MMTTKTKTTKTKTNTTKANTTKANTTKTNLVDPFAAPAAAKQPKAGSVEQVQVPDAVGALLDERAKAAAEADAAATRLSALDGELREWATEHELLPRALAGSKPSVRLVSKAGAGATCYLQDRSVNMDDGAYETLRALVGDLTADEMVEISGETWSLDSEMVQDPEFREKFRSAMNAAFPPDVVGRMLIHTAGKRVSRKGVLGRIGALCAACADKAGLALGLVVPKATVK